MSRDLDEAIARKLGTKVLSLKAIGGGDINDAAEVLLEDRRRVFVKSHARAPSGMFSAEARGLAWLAEAEALRIPEVLAVSDGSRGDPAFLILELLPSSPRKNGFDETFGRGLARLHRYGAPSFGLEHDNFIGTLPQDNEPCADWPTFYRERRLEPQVRQATERGLVTGSLGRRFGRLFDDLEKWVGPGEPPSRLHGDLWAGNLHVDDRGEPCLIDPAAHGGHREVDLAMMRLFGGFGPAVFAAYEEEHPLAEGAEERVSLYQLYPLLVHVNLFGAGYLGSVERALSPYV